MGLDHGSLSPTTLHARTLADLLRTADRVGRDATGALLDDSLDVAASYLGTLGFDVDADPRIRFDQFLSGVTYDPHPDGIDDDTTDSLAIGGPRGSVRGGYEVLGEAGYSNRLSVLAVLCKGLVHSHHQHLAEEFFETYDALLGWSPHDVAAAVERGDLSVETACDAESLGRDRPEVYRVLGVEDAGDRSTTRREEVEIYDTLTRGVVPAVDEAIAQLLCLHVDGDLTDRDLRRRYVAAWERWYRQHSTVAVDDFVRICRTCDSRIERALADFDAGGGVGSGTDANGDRTADADAAVPGLPDFDDPRGRVAARAVLSLSEPLVGDCDRSVVGDPR